MTDYEAALDNMNAQVDNRLGDSISYTRSGGAAETKLGFIFLDTDDGISGGIDALAKRWKVKIDKAVLGAKPSALDRLTHFKLGPATYRPSVDTLSDGGNAYIFDIQKVAA